MYRLKLVGHVAVLEGDVLTRSPFRFSNEAGPCGGRSGGQAVVRARAGQDTRRERLSAGSGKKLKNFRNVPRNRALIFPLRVLLSVPAEVEVSDTDTEAVRHDIEPICRISHLVTPPLNHPM